MVLTQLCNGCSWYNICTNKLNNFKIKCEECIVLPMCKNITPPQNKRRCLNDCFILQSSFKGKFCGYLEKAIEYKILNFLSVK